MFKQIKLLLSLAFVVHIAYVSSVIDGKAIMKTLVSHSGPKIYLLSYPRSGNTWMRYCIEALTQRPTAEYNPEAKSISLPLGYTCGHSLDLSMAPVWKVHNRDQFNFAGYQHNSQSDVLIFLIRNPKEAIIRHVGKVPLNRLFFGAALNKFKLYFEDLNIYNQWSGKKILIYYEDFITNPRDTLDRLLKFLGDSGNELNVFFAEYEKHKAMAIKFYDFFGGSQTQGNDLLYYSRKLPPRVRKSIDLWALKFNANLWNIYLKDRYSEEVLEKNNLYKEQIINKQIKLFLD